MPQIYGASTESDKQISALDRNFVDDLFSNELLGTVVYFTEGDETIKNALIDKYLEDVKLNGETISSDGIRAWLRKLLEDD